MNRRGLRLLISPLEGNAPFRFLTPMTFLQARSLCSKRDEVYQQLEKLDFMTAAKILFTEPPKKKKFGFGFHLVQFISVCMPPLAVYLVAQYARYEMRRMEAELEAKKKLAEEEERAKEAEMESDMAEAGSDSELSQLKMRLDALEKTIEEIMDKSKKFPGKKKSNDLKRESKSSSCGAADGDSSKSHAGEPRLEAVRSDPATNMSQEQDKQGTKSENAVPCQEVKR